MSPKIVDKELKRKEILLAAMNVFAKKGLKDIKIDEIAAAAGIGKGTVYEYFSNKEEMFGAMILEFMQSFEDALAKNMFRAKTHKDKIKVLTDSWVEVIKGEDSETISLMIDIWAESIRQTNPEITRIFDMKAIYHEYRSMVAAIIDDGINGGTFRKVDSVLTAGTLLAALDGLIIQWLLDKETFDMKAAADALYDSFINGIAAK